MKETKLTMEIFGDFRLRSGESFDDWLKSEQS
jgi:hypothetical protein